MLHVLHKNRRFYILGQERGRVADEGSFVSHAGLLYGFHYLIPSPFSDVLFYAAATSFLFYL
jgi:hypothetical protein